MTAFKWTPGVTWISKEKTSTSIINLAFHVQHALCDSNGTDVLLLGCHDSTMQCEIKSTVSVYSPQFQCRHLISSNRLAIAHDETRRVRHSITHFWVSSVILIDGVVIVNDSIRSTKTRKKSLNWLVCAHFYVFTLKRWVYWRRCRGQRTDVLYRQFDVARASFRRTTSLMHASLNSTEFCCCRSLRNSIIAQNIEILMFLANYNERNSLICSRCHHIGNGQANNAFGFRSRCHREMNENDEKTFWI